MNQLKRSFLFTFLFTTITFLGPYALAEPSFLHHEHWFFMLEGNALKADNSHTGYTVTQDVGQDSASPFIDGNLIHVGTDYHIGGGLTIGRLLWDHLSDVRFTFFTNNHNDRHEQLPEGEDELRNILLPADLDEGNLYIGRAAQSHYHYRDSRFALLFGHWFVPNKRLYVHPYMGLKLADVRVHQRTLYSHYNMLPDTEIIEEAGTTGLGPTSGVNVYYRLTHSLGLEGNIGLALFMGNLRSSGRIDSLPEEGDGTSYGDLTSKSRLSIFEGLQSSVALSYQAPLSPMALFHVSLGYKISEYMNIVRSYRALQANMVLQEIEGVGASGPFLRIGVDLT